jgi:hypothetical protein
MTGAIALDALGEWLAAEVGAGGEPVAVLAGHFAIFSAGGVASDLLDAGTPSLAGAREMLDFSRVTWRAACLAGARRPSPPFRLVVLMDDVQFVRPQLNDRGLSERLAAELAAGYLDAVPRVPPYHARELAAHGIADECILQASAHQWLFSERQLRIDAVRHLRQHHGSDAREGSRLISSADGSTVSVALADGGDYCLIHSGRTSCVGGYIELLSRLHARGVRKLVAMVPMRCLGQIALGTLLARRLFDLANLSVVNVAVPDPAVGLPAHVVPTGP